VEQTSRLYLVSLSAAVVRAAPEFCEMLKLLFEESWRIHDAYDVSIAIIG
jgi:hypothetical protein